MIRWARGAMTVLCCSRMVGLGFRYETATPMPYAFDVPLAAGFVRLELTLRNVDRQTVPALELEWVPPGGLREPLPPSSLFHRA